MMGGASVFRRTRVLAQTLIEKRDHLLADAGRETFEEVVPPRDTRMFPHFSKGQKARLCLLAGCAAQSAHRAVVYQSIDEGHDGMRRLYMKVDPNRREKETLERTSVQLPRKTIELLDNWPELSRSDALRLTLDRYRYLESLIDEQADNFADKYYPVFHAALSDLGFHDYKLVARSLPGIVMGAMAEEAIRERVERERRQRELVEINWSELQKELLALPASIRIRILDYVTGQRLLRISSDRDFRDERVV